MVLNVWFILGDVKLSGLTAHLDVALTFAGWPDRLQRVCGDDAEGESRWWRRWHYEESREQFQYHT